MQHKENQANGISNPTQPTSSAQTIPTCEMLQEYSSSNRHTQAAYELL
jgi:hypothetical protein